MLDIVRARQESRDEMISDISLVRSTWNIGDSLTKQMFQVVLRDVLFIGNINMVREKWIISRN